MLESLQLVGDTAPALELGAALGAALDVPQQGRNAKALLAIHEEIEFIREKMPVFHVCLHGFYDGVPKKVSEQIQAKKGNYSRSPPSASRNWCRARWMYVLTVPSGKSNVAAISSYDRPSTCRSRMQERYSGRRAAMALSMAVPSSRASISSSADSCRAATSKPWPQPRQPTLHAEIHRC